MEHCSEHFDFVENGGVASAEGFSAAGVAAGFKKSGKPDFAVILSDRPCEAAGTFTSNLFPAAPVRLCRERLAAGSKIRAVIVNSGIANACTGAEGYSRAQRSTEIAASLLGVPADSVLAASTGRIGDPLPMDILEKGLHEAVRGLAHGNGTAAAEAIMTTDTRRKEIAVTVRIGGRTVTVGGMTKGAGMISPRMLVCRPHATMLCFLTTDAAIAADDLPKFIEEGVRVSFNRISVDNDMSTNDTCLLLANGASGVSIAHGTQEGALFAEALRMVMQHLAKAMVLDGEGSTKFISVEVNGARNAAEAELCAKAVADSMLCKTAWFGGDPNWGRVLAAAGYSGAHFSPENVSLDFDEMPVVRHGLSAGTTEAELAPVVARREFRVILDLGEGLASCVRWTSDISHEYVTINADYHT